MKILIAEGDPITRRVLQANLLKWGYEVMLALDDREALDMIQRPDPPSLLISDWMMPHVDGLTLCREIRNLKITPYLYVILLSTEGGNEDTAQGLEAGADDFLTKPINHEALKDRIRIGERIIGLEHRLLEMTGTDPLTGVMNRRAFMGKLEQETARAHRNKAQLSFILTDIDHFRQVNDTHGHRMGDLVLQCFSKTLKAILRPYDFLGRYRGEEFVICMPGADANQAESAAERLRAEIEEMDMILPDDEGLFRVTASFGTATCDLDSREEVKSLIKRADAALSLAKAEGRNRVCGA